MRKTVKYTGKNKKLLLVTLVASESEIDKATCFSNTNLYETTTTEEATK